MVATVLDVALAIAYPIAIFLGLTYLGTRGVSLLVIALLIPGLALRFRKADRESLRSILRIPVAIFGLVVCGIVTDDARFMLALPVLINAVLFVTFASSLRAGSQPMVERFARMQEPALTPDKAAHCRTWTQLWSAFFVLNGGVAAGLGLAAPLWWWTVYTGAIAYVLMGLMFVAERIQRRVRFGS